MQFVSRRLRAAVRTAGALHEGERPVELDRPLPRPAGTFPFERLGKRSVRGEEIYVDQWWRLVENLVGLGHGGDSPTALRASGERVRGGNEERRITVSIGPRPS